MGVPAWAWWLLAPATVTLLAAVLVWVAGRPPRVPSTQQSMRRHSAFLATLEQRAPEPSAAARRHGH